MTKRPPAHGLTLVELLLSLGLLSALTVVMLSWTSVAAHSAGAFAGQVGWERSARAILRMIGEDVASADFEQQRRGVAQPPRIRIASDQLTVRTRTASGASEDRPYRLDQWTLRTSEHVLLESVKRFQCELDEDERWLEVTIVAAHGDSAVTRRFRLP